MQFKEQSDVNVTIAWHSTNTSVKIWIISALILFDFHFIDVLILKVAVKFYFTLNTPQTKFPEDACFVSLDVSVRAAVLSNMIKHIPCL